MKLPSPRRKPASSACSDEDTFAIEAARGGKRGWGLLVGRGGSSTPSYSNHTWALDAVVDNLVFTRDKITAWYLLEPQMWSFRPEADAEGIIEDQASQLAQLTGRTIHLRVTTRPYPVSEWAKRHVDNAIDPLPVFRGDFMTAEYAHLANRTHSSKLAYYGIELGGRGAVESMLAKLSESIVDREMATWQERIDEVTNIMRQPGIEARPALGRDMEWLLYRSFWLGLPAANVDAGPGTRVWDAGDLAQFTESSRWYTDGAYDPTVKVVGRSGGNELTRHVVVLTLGRCEDFAVPQDMEPWMARTDRLPFPVEWSGRVTVRKTDEVTREMQRLAERIDNQYRHYTVDHNQRPPKSLSRQADRAADVEDDLRSGFNGLATRTKGWYRVAVSGRTEREALDRARKVEELYSPSIKVERTFDQYALAREFVPGEPLGNTAHVRHFPVLKVAAAFPAATSEVGDPRGIYLGTTCGFSERVVTWDPWYLTEVVETTGLTPIVGGLGSGKSVLMGMIIYKTLIQGVPWTVLDPSGRLNALCDLPELAGYARAINLVGADDGTLNPFRVVAEPVRDHFEEEKDPEAAYFKARSQAEQTRRDLCRDILRWCLPHNLSKRESTEDLLGEAVREVKATAYASPWQVIENLERIGTEDARLIAAELRTASAREQASLFFPAGYQLDYSAQDAADTLAERTLLTVLNLKGVVLPDKDTPIEEWGWEERLGRPLLNLSAWLAMRSIYRGDPHERKGLALDEAHEITNSAVGRKLVQKTATDTRKHNTKALVATQNAQYVLGADIGNFVGSAFVGKTIDPDAQAAAIRLAQLPVGYGYESTLARLSPRRRTDEQHLGYREFIFKDGMGGEEGRGGVEKIRVDLENHPHLLAALNTTSDPTKARARRQLLLDPETAEEHVA